MIDLASLRNLVGVVPALVSVVGIAIMIRNLYILWRGMRPPLLRGFKAFALSQGIVGVAGMMASLCIYDVIPQFKPEEFFFFLMVFTTLGAILTLCAHQLLSEYNLWPDIFKGVRKMADSRSRQQNLSYSISLLGLIYATYGIFYFLAPDDFVESPQLKTKSRVFILLFGPWESLLTWAWVASAFIGLFVACLIYIPLYEISWRKNSKITVTKLR
jgi:hypothetical protein